MTAKDKEKLKITKIMIENMKDDVIVINPDDFRMRGSQESKKDEDDKPESKEQEKAPEASDAEKLSNGIVEFLADSAANDFAVIMEVIPDELGEIILDLLNQADSEMFVSLLQAVFSIAGMDYAADQLELMKYCYEYDEFAYYYFEDEFVDNDATESYFTEQFFRDLLQDEHDNRKR